MNFVRLSTGKIHVKKFGMVERIVLLTFVLMLFLTTIPYFSFNIAIYLNNQLSHRYYEKAIFLVELIDKEPSKFSPPEIQSEFLSAANIESIIMNKGGKKIALTSSEKNLNIEEIIDLRTAGWGTLIWNGYRTLLYKPSGMMKIIGNAQNTESIEVIVNRDIIRLPLLRYVRRVVVFGLIISLLVGLVGYVALRTKLVSPLQKMTQNMTSFGNRPEDISLIWQPSERLDEIGLAEHALADMETSLSTELHQKRRLAELGLSISKINHELRNLLTSAHLISDQLGIATGATLQRALPRLKTSLNRAIDFCEATLAYGRVQEPSPNKQTVLLTNLIEDLRDLAEKNGKIIVRFEYDIPDGLAVEADPSQMLRAFANIIRNAVQAFAALRSESLNEPPKIRFLAAANDDEVTILIDDNGPGLPEKIKKNPFAAFHGTTKSGGSGLGLAISAELVNLQGGTLTYEETERGARFRFIIPKGPYVTQA